MTRFQTCQKFSGFFSLHHKFETNTGNSRSCSIIQVRETTMIKLLVQKSTFIARKVQYIIVMLLLQL